MVRDYKNIKAYKLADDLVIAIYKASKKFPKEEQYGLTSQLRRSAVSVPTNIAEGASRKHKRDFLHFLYIARGSLAEVGYLLHLTNRLGYLKDTEFTGIDPSRDEVAKVLYGLIMSVEKEAKIFSRIIALFTSGIILNSTDILKPYNFS